MLYVCVCVCARVAIECFYRENDISEVIDTTFCVEHDRFGRIAQINLKPDGRDIPVTNENKEEYVR